MDKVTAIGASVLANGATLAILIKLLNRKGVLSDAEVVELYEAALQLLEEQQGESPASQHVFEIARELIEEHLRGQPKPE